MEPRSCCGQISCNCYLVGEHPDDIDWQERAEKAQQEIAALKAELVGVQSKYEQDMERMEGVAKGLHSENARLREALERISNEICDCPDPLCCGFHEDIAREALGKE